MEDFACEASLLTSTSVILADSGASSEEVAWLDEVNDDGVKRGLCCRHQNLEDWPFRRPDFEGQDISLFI